MWKSARKVRQAHRHIKKSCSSAGAVRTFVRLDICPIEGMAVFLLRFAARQAWRCLPGCTPPGCTPSGCTPPGCTPPGKFLFGRSESLCTCQNKKGDCEFVLLRLPHNLLGKILRFSLFTNGPSSRLKPCPSLSSRKLIFKSSLLRLF